MKFRNKLIALILVSGCWFGVSAQTLVATDPADGAMMTQFSGVTLKFDQAVTPKRSWSTDVKIRKDSPTGSNISVAEWTLEKTAANEVRIYPVNNAGNLSPVAFESGVDYWLSIPAGEVKEYQNPISLHYKGETLSALTIASIDPADESVLSVFNGVAIEFDRAVTLRSSWSNKIFLSKGSPSGQKVAVAEWEMEKRGDNVAFIYPGNNSGYLSPVDFEDGTEYYLTIPGGEIKEWSEPIIIKYVGPAPVVEHVPVLYGTLLYSDNWESGKSKVGMYRIQADGNGGFQPVLLDPRLSAQMGGAKVGNRYFASFGNDIGLTTLWVNTLWDTETWTPVYIDPNGSQQSMASCLTTDPTTGTVYGSFADDTFGTVNILNGQRSTISSLPAAWSAIACGADGTLYAVDMSGCLLEIDKVTGEIVVIGSTGLTPQYMTSAAIDPESGRMFYALHSENGCGMYEISTSDGSSELLFEMPGNEWFAGMYVPGAEAVPEAPGMPSDFTASWSGPSSSGSISFMAPVLAYNGQQLSGPLTYNVKQAGNSLASGTCQPGEEVSAEIEVAEVGMTNLILSVSNAQGESPKAYLNVWAGADTPDAPQGVSLVKNTDGGYTISWNPVTTAFNGGWIDPSEILYTVKRFPDETIVADNIAETTFTDLTNHLAGVQFHYEVTARYLDKVSRPGISPEMKSGVIIPPFYAGFDDRAEAETFTVLNSNNDSEKWEWNSSKKAMRLSASSSRPMDDWLITPAIELEAGLVYTFSLDASSQSSSYPETFEVKMGTSPEAAAMTKVLIEPTTVTSTSMTSYSAMVKVSETGPYYLGIHGMSEADTYSIYVDNVSVSAGEAQDFPNLVLMEAAAPRYIEAGQRFIVNARIQNNGTVIPENAYLVIYSAANEVGRSEIGDIATGEQKIVGAEIASDRTWNENVVLTAEIEWESDAQPEDNTSDPMTLKVHIPVLPVVQTLTATSDGNETVISWQKPDLSATSGETLTEDFEQYEPFDFYRAGEWVFYDADGAGTFGFVNDKVAFPGMGDPSAFFVFDVSLRNEYRQQEALQSHSGDKYLASFASMGQVQTENWVMSPRLNGESQYISFYAKAFSSQYGESFDVLASTSGMAENDFSTIKTYRNIPTTWTKYEIQLPANSIFFAIRHNSVDSYMMMVDDISYTSAGPVDSDLRLVGYNVYADGACINDEQIANTEYRHPNVTPGTQYCVETIYNKGISEKSESVTASMTGVDVLMENETDIEYYDVMGRRIIAPLPNQIVIEKRGTTIVKRIL